MKRFTKLRVLVCILKTRNQKAMRGRRYFSYAIDDVVRKFLAFVQGIIISHQISRVADYANVELADIYFVYGDADWPSAQCLYAERFPTRHIPVIISLQAKPTPEVTLGRFISLSWQEEK